MVHKPVVEWSNQPLWIWPNPRRMVAKSWFSCLHKKKMKGELFRIYECFWCFVSVLKADPMLSNSWAPAVRGTLISQWWRTSTEKDRDMCGIQKQTNGEPRRIPHFLFQNYAAAAAAATTTTTTTRTRTRKNKNIIFELGSICIKTLDTNVWWNSLLTQNTQFTCRGVLHSGIHCVSGWTKPIQSNLPGPQVHYKETSTWKIFPTACLRFQNLWPLRSYLIHLSPPTSQQLGDMEGLAARDLSSTRSSSGGFLEAAWCLPSYKCGKTELPTSCWTLAKQTCDADWLVTTSSWVVLQEISFDRRIEVTSSQKMEQAPWRLHCLYSELEKSSYSTHIQHGAVSGPDPGWLFFSGCEAHPSPDVSAEQHLDEKESAATLEDLLRSLVDHTLLRLSPDWHRTVVPKGGIPLSFGFDESGLFVKNWCWSTSVGLKMFKVDALRLRDLSVHQVCGWSGEVSPVSVRSSK